MQSKKRWLPGKSFSSATRFCTETKKISLEFYTENRVLRGDSRFINLECGSTGKELSKVQKQCLELLQKTQESILELIKLIDLLFSTIQPVLPAQRNFRCLQQKQIQALKTQGSYCKKVILNGNPKEENKIWKFAMVVTWFCFTVKCWYKQIHPKRDGIQDVRGYQQCLAVWTKLGKDYLGKEFQKQLPISTRWKISKSNYNSSWTMLASWCDKQQIIAFRCDIIKF